MTEGSGVQRDEEPLDKPLPSLNGHMRSTVWRPRGRQTPPSCRVSRVNTKAYDKRGDQPWATSPVIIPTKLLNNKVTDLRSLCGWVLVPYWGVLIDVFE